MATKRWESPHKGKSNEDAKKTGACLNLDASEVSIMLEKRNVWLGSRDNNILEADKGHQFVIRQLWLLLYDKIVSIPGEWQSLEICKPPSYLTIILTVLLLHVCWQYQPQSAATLAYTWTVFQKTSQWKTQEWGLSQIKSIDSMRPK